MFGTMSKLLEELINYLDNTSKEVLEENLKQLEPYTKIGPTADEYLKNINDIQLYNYYLSIELPSVGHKSWIYPNYVIITGLALCSPHPCRHFTFDEFVEKLYSDNEFKNLLNGKIH